MHTSSTLQARVLAASTRIARFALLTAFAAGAAATVASPNANASSGMCEQGACTHQGIRSSDDLRSISSLSDLARSEAIRRGQLSDQEYFSFSGVGAIVCTVNGEQRNATAFLVGAFDIGVTVAHTFTANGEWVEPQDCVYTTTDSLGQIRERIPVAYIKAQWASEEGAFGQVAKDLAVIRLAEPSRFAQRTMPLGKFSGFGANVLMIGFKADIDAGTIKVKTQGRVYDRKANGLSVANLAGFTHDMDARGIAPGAPVIDEKSGVIIGLHTLAQSKGKPSRNTMITMNEWLEATIRAEMQTESAAKVN